MGSRGKNNIEYQAEQPSFLRKLRAQQGGFDTDRHERPMARPRKAKAAGDDDDDAPTYVDEESNRTLSKAEYDELVNGNSAEGASTNDMTGNEDGNVDSTAVETTQESASTHSDAIRGKQELAEAGKTVKKRKIVKVIGNENHDDESQLHAKKEAGKKPKKKKVVALSFGDDEG